MKSPYYIASLIALLCYFESPAQKIIKEGILSYYETRSTVNNLSGKPIIRTTLRTASFSPEALKVVSLLRKGIVNTVITTCKENHSVAFISNGKDFYRFEDARNNQLLQMGNYQQERSSVTYSDETAVIAGYNCKKAIMTAYADEQKEEIEVWYTPDLKIEPGCFSFFFQQVKGLPVSFTFKEHPKATISGTTPATMEYLLADISETNGARLDTVADQQKYVTLTDENEKRTTIMQMVLGAAPPVATRGTAQTETIASGNGNTITLSRYNPFTVGTVLPAFEGITLTHMPLSAASLQGKPAVLNFWFTGCGPCIKEMPLLNKVAATYATAIAFVAITHDEEITVTRFLETHAFHFTQLINAKGIIDKMGVSSYPTTVLVDSKGIIRFVKVGGFTDEAELAHAIDELLKTSR